MNDILNIIKRIEGQYIDDSIIEKIVDALKYRMRIEVTKHPYYSQQSPMLITPYQTESGTWMFEVPSNYSAKNSLTISLIVDGTTISSQIVEI